MKLPWKPLAVFAACAVVLLPGVVDYGVTWDESYPNLPAARRHAQWLTGVFSIPHPFSEATIAEYWESTSDHPTLVRTTAAVGIAVFGGVWSEPTAARIPLALAFAAFLAVLYAWLARRFRSPWPGLWAVVALLFYPRIFAHAHFASIDLPMAMMWAGMLMLFLWAGERSWARAIVAGLFFGLVLATKLHSFFLPLVFFPFDVLLRRLHARVYAMMALLGPLVYIAVQPVLWPHPIQSIMERLLGLSEKVGEGPIRMYYLGQMHFGDTPWHYPLVMTLVTMPLPVLFCVALAAREGWARWQRRARTPESEEERRIAAAIAAHVGERGGNERDWPVLFALGMFVPFAIVLLPMAQAYDGIRLILPGIVCLVILSSLGFARASAWVLLRLLHWPVERLRAVPAALILLFALPGAWMTWSMHPWQLSHYNLVGAAVGRDRFERTYWCEGLTRDVLADLNRRLTPNARLRPMSTSWEQLRYCQERGWLRDDIEMPENPPYDYHLMQVRQGMFSEVGWRMFRNGRRMAEYGPPGRPVYILFGRFGETFE